MQEITLDELDALSPQVEAAVDATPLIDPWCSGPDWQIPVSVAFDPEPEPLLLTTDDHDGFALLTRYKGQHYMFGGMEPLWGFGTPIIGHNPYAVAAEVAQVLAERDDWKTLFLTGMPILNEPTNEELEAEESTWQPQPDPTVTLGIANGLAPLGRVGLAEGITRRIADLEPSGVIDFDAADRSSATGGSNATDDTGYERWLGRRTARFRRNLRKATAQAEAEGLTIEDAADDPDLFDRLIAIEHRTWKGQEGSGITSTEMSAMYRMIIDRLRKSGRLQAHVARHRNADVGYILGGVRARRYRGLQLSFTDEARDLSVGNLLQNHQLQQLDASRLADTYDLGMDFEYKKRWADRSQTSLTLVLRRR